MSNGIRARAVSAPVTSLELRELNKYRDKRICKEDLQLFIDKYKKESKVLNFLRGLPPEIHVLKLIVNKYNSLFTNHTLISNEDKELLSAMVAMNKEHRPDKPRLRDLIIDNMIKFFDLEKDIERQYLSFEDYL